MFRSHLFLLGSLISLLLSGCAHFRTAKSHHAEIEASIKNGNYDAAVSALEAAKEAAYKEKDRVVYLLDSGMLHHWNGEYEKSNQQLEQAEWAIEAYFTRSLTRSASALFLNENLQNYSGEDFEDVYLNVFKALNYLALNQVDSAFVEVRRINDKLAYLDQKYARSAEQLNRHSSIETRFEPPSSRFVDSALGRYLSLMLYRQEKKWDDVRIDAEKIATIQALQPTLYPFPLPSLKKERTRSPKPSARLNIVAFAGRAPQKTARTFYIHTEKDLILLGHSHENYLGGQHFPKIGILPWPGINAGYHFKLQLPFMKKRASVVYRVEVEVEGAGRTPLHPIESLERAALETFRIKKPLIYLRSLSRSILKGMAAQKAKEKWTRDMGDWAALFTRILTDLAVDSTEHADLRGSRFFPATASVAELHLPSGTYTLHIHYYSAKNRIIHTDTHTNVIVRADRLNLIESVYLN